MPLTFNSRLFHWPIPPLPSRLRMLLRLPWQAK